MAEARWRTLRVATYNIHRCRGLDGRTNPARIADVIRAIEPDVIALQEVIGASPSGPGHAEELGALLGMGWVMAPTRHLRGSLFGNVVLSRVLYPLSTAPCAMVQYTTVSEAAAAIRTRTHALRAGDILSTLLRYCLGKRNVLLRAVRLRGCEAAGL